MAQIQARIVGVELYFEHLQAARDFYAETVGLEVSNEELGRHAQFSSASGFVCLEKKGVEAYPSRDQAVLFFEVPDLRSAIQAIGETRFVQREEDGAVMHDPEGHNVLLLQRRGA